MAESIKTARRSFDTGRRPNGGDYHRNRDVVDRLIDEVTIRAFSEERNLPILSSPDDLAEEIRILRDAIAEINRLRGGSNG